MLKWGDITSLFKSKINYDIKSLSLQPTNIIENAWCWILQEYSEFGLFLIFYLSMAILYALGGFIFYLFDKYKLFSKRKIQVNKYPSPQDIKRCVNNLVVNYVLVVLPLGILSFPFSRFLGMTYSLPLPSVWKFTLDIFICLIGEDFFHYWMHRFFHTKMFYKIHKEHHYYSSPFGLTASYAHPIEVVFLGFATFAPALIIRPHYFTFYSWFVIRQLDAVLTHSGYDFDIFPLSLLPFYESTFHDEHHRIFTYNYGSRFTYLDKLFGTYKESPKKFKNQKTK